MQSAEITRAQKITVLKREVAMRQRVYPRMVRDGKMSEADAERETAVMSAILADYAEVVHEVVDSGGAELEDVVQ